MFAICFGFGFGLWAVLGSAAYGPSPRMTAFACGLMLYGWWQVEQAARRKK